MGLGDTVEKALETIGITKERVEKFLGRPCSCSERKARLNRLSAWAFRVFLGKTEDAKEHLDLILDDEEAKKNKEAKEQKQ